jgi:hypothetical protein
MGIEMTEPERLTPQQAWEHVRALCPRATHIRQVNGGQCEIEGKGGYQTFTDKVIDWCDLTQWPHQSQPSSGKTLSFQGTAVKIVGIYYRRYQMNMNPER